MASYLYSTKLDSFHILNFASLWGFDFQLTFWNKKLALQIQHLVNLDLQSIIQSDTLLAGGFNPFEKYDRQNGNLPQFSG